MREDITEILAEAGSSYTTTYYTLDTEDTWGKIKTNSSSTETLLIIERIYGERLRREGQKNIAQYIILANWDSSLAVGENITIDSNDAWIRYVYRPEVKGNYIAKVITAIVEEWR